MFPFNYMLLMYYGSRCGFDNRHFCYTVCRRHELKFMNHKLWWKVFKDAQRKGGRTLRVPWLYHSAIKGSNVLRRFINQNPWNPFLILFDVLTKNFVCYFGTIETVDHVLFWSVMFCYTRNCLIIDQFMVKNNLKICSKNKIPGVQVSV